MAAKKITAPAEITEAAETAEDTTIKTTDAPKPEQLLTYGEAAKLVAGILRGNPNNSGAEVIECIRDIMDGTGLDVTYEAQEEEEQEAA